MLHNIQPGTQLMDKQPALFWGLIASMWLGNLMLVVLNLAMVGLWVKLLSIPYRLLYPAIKLAELPGVTPHTLRHTLGSTAVSSGESLKMTGGNQLEKSYNSDN